MGCDTTGLSWKTSPVDRVKEAWKQSRTEFRSNSSSHTLASGTAAKTQRGKGSGTQVRQHSTASCHVSALIGSEVTVFVLVFRVSYRALSLQCCLGNLIRLKPTSRGSCEGQNWQKPVWEIPSCTVKLFIFLFYSGIKWCFFSLAANINRLPVKSVQQGGIFLEWRLFYLPMTITSLPWSKDN